MSDFRREVRFEAGYDHREEDAGKPSGQRRGCGAMHIRFLLHGEKGTTQFLVSTGWLPTWVTGVEYPAVKPLPRDRRVWDLYPSGMDFGHHWDTATYEGEYQPDSCDVRPGGTCFYDGSGLYAGKVLARLLREGDAAVWEELETYYRSLTGGGES